MTNRIARTLALALGLAGLSLPSTASAVGDLLVAPTRVVLDGARGTEVILSNIGTDTATYRVSLELRRMTPEGTLDDVDITKANDKENQSLAMVSYAPRRVVLAPNQPQAIRIGLRPPADLPDGEYRVHMLFRAIPAARPVETPVQTSGLSIALTPIYGVTIPVIMRKGKLEAVASLANARLQKGPEGPELALTINRQGTRSTFGLIRVFKPGKADPVVEARGIAVYPEVAARTVELPLDPAVAATLAGPATIQYVEEPEAGGRVIAEIKTTIR